jgi:8-oxo-dGTP pyrophosphatase MutT (NUDIX family)
MEDGRNDGTAQHAWRRVATTTIFANRFYLITRDRLLHPLGQELDYDVIRPLREAVGVVAQRGQGREAEVLLVRQWRHTIQRVLWSIPAGGIDDGESPLDAAARELREEAGCVAGRVEPLFHYHPSVGVSSQTFHVFLAQNLRELPGAKLDPVEIIEARWFARAEVDRMIDAGELLDGFTITALLRWLRHTAR